MKNIIYIFYQIFTNAQHYNTVHQIGSKLFLIILNEKTNCNKIITNITLNQKV